MGGETGRVDTGVPEEWTFLIEKKYHEFHQRLIKLKETGDRPKGKRLSQHDLWRVVVRKGIDAVLQMDYEGFEKALAECRKGK